MYTVAEGSRITPDSKEDHYFWDIADQFLDFQNGKTNQIPKAPSGGDALQIYKRARLMAADMALDFPSPKSYAHSYRKYFGLLGENSWGVLGVNGNGDYDIKVKPLLDADKDGEIEHHFGSVGDKAKVPAGKGDEFAEAMAVASAMAKTYKAFEEGRRATPAEIAINVDGWKNGLKKKYKTYDAGFTVDHADYEGSVISTINKAMGDNTDKLSLPSSFKAPGLVDAPGLKKAPAAPAPSPTQKAPAAPAAPAPTFLTPEMLGINPPVATPPAAKKSAAVTKFTKDSNASEVAFGELSRSGLVPEFMVNATIEAFNAALDVDSSTPAMNASFKKDYLRTKDPKYILAMAMNKRVDAIIAAQDAGKTFLPVPTQAEILAFTKDPFGDKTSPAPAPAQQAPAAPAPAPQTPAAPDAADAADAPEAPAKVNYKKAKLLPTSELAEKNLALYDDDLVKMAAAGKYLERGSHWLSDGQDGEMSKANQALIQELERSLDRVNEGKKAGDDGSDDGVYGGGVEKAVRAIQRQYGLVSKHGNADGKAGIKTITALQVEELKTLLDAGGNAKEVAYEVKDIQTLLGEDGKLANGQRIPAKVKAEIKLAVEKIEADTTLAADTKLIAIVQDIREKAGIAKA